MATTLQQLLDQLSRRAVDHGSPAGAAAVEDAAGALGHARRALHRLAIDGMDRAVGSPRERMVDELAAACSAAAAPWPPGTSATGRLTDLMGAAADVAGRLRPLLGPEERWAAAVEFTTVASRCAELARQLVPLAAPREFDRVHQAVAVIERTAQQKPPALAGAAALDRLVPCSDLPPGLTGTQAAAEAAASLVAAIAGAHDRGGLTLREFRLVCGAGQSVSDYAAAVVAAMPGGRDGQPWRSAAIAWQVARNATAVFKDGRWDRPAVDVMSRARVIPAALARDLGPPQAIDVAVLRARADLPLLLTHLQQTANQLPVIAGQLHATTGRWGIEGLLRAHARDLPAMDDMPEDRIRQVLAGQLVQAAHQDLAPLSAAVTRAGSLSTALAAELNQTTPGVPPAQPRLAAYYADRLATPHAAAQMTSDARHVQRALAATRAPFGPGQPHSRGYGPDR